MRLISIGQHEIDGDLVDCAVIAATRDELAALAPRLHQDVVVLPEVFCGWASVAFHDDEVPVNGFRFKASTGLISEVRSRDPEDIAPLLRAWHETAVQVGDERRDDREAIEAFARKNDFDLTSDTEIVAELQRRADAGDSEDLFCHVNHAGALRIHVEADRRALVAKLWPAEAASSTESPSPT